MVHTSLLERVLRNPLRPPLSMLSRLSPSTWFRNRNWKLVSKARRLRHIVPGVLIPAGYLLLAAMDFSQNLVPGYQDANIGVTVSTL